MEKWTRLRMLGNIHATALQVEAGEFTSNGPQVVPGIDTPCILGLGPGVFDPKPLRGTSILDHSGFGG